MFPIILIIHNSYVLCIKDRVFIHVFEAYDNLPKTIFGRQNQNFENFRYTNLENSPYITGFYI